MVSLLCNRGCDDNPDHPQMCKYIKQYKYTELPVEEQLYLKTRMDDM